MSQKLSISKKLSKLVQPWRFQLLLLGQTVLNFGLKQLGTPLFLTVDWGWLSGRLINRTDITRQGGGGRWGEQGLRNLKCKWMHRKSERERCGQQTGGRVESEKFLHCIQKGQILHMILPPIFSSPLHPLHHPSENTPTLQSWLTTF